jgi:hypothetical protein
MWDLCTKGVKMVRQIERGTGKTVRRKEGEI